jgi:hypothetical protein
MSPQYASERQTLYALLAEELRSAARTASEAHQAALRGESNEALGTLLPAIEKLEISGAFCKSIVALHRKAAQRRAIGTQNARGAKIRARS